MSRYLIRRIEENPAIELHTRTQIVALEGDGARSTPKAHQDRIRPHLLETSLPGVFAVGDVRGGNVKRVASAVGERSIAVSFVQQVLHE